MRALLEQIARNWTAARSTAGSSGSEAPLVEVAGAAPYDIGRGAGRDRDAEHANPLRSRGFSGGHALLMPFATLEGVGAALPRGGLEHPPQGVPNDTWPGQGHPPGEPT